MVYRTADDVADMEQELHELRATLESTRRSLELVQQERNRLQLENALLDGKARETLVRATRIETIISQVATMLVSGLNEVKQERDAARSMRRQSQDIAIERENEDDPPPQFLRSTSVRAQPEPELPAPRKQRSIGMTEAEGQQLRADALVGAAERIAPRRPTQIDHTLANRDPRLPQNEFYTAEDADRDSLREIADQMEPKGN